MKHCVYWRWQKKEVDNYKVINSNGEGQKKF